MIHILAFLSFLSGFAIPKDKVYIITRSNCWFSNNMRKFLIKNKIPYEEHNVTEKGDNRVKVGLDDSTTFPAVFAKGKYIGGYDESVGQNKLKIKLGLKSDESLNLVIS